MSDKITHEIVRHLTVLGTSSGSWNKELNLVSWNGRDAKLDVRDWPADHGKCGKGTTLTYEEARDLCRALTVYLREGE
ncbi:MAG: hypothetical protein IJ061_06500 [Lachnospiraceae bacterium]|nr:hypothetical protein [Lachnospiraceae bacterium]